MNRSDKYTRFIEGFGRSVRENELMSAYTTFGTGGQADLFIDASDTDSLSRAIVLARKLSIPYFVIGQGSNLLVSDSGYRGLIIRNCIRRIEVQGNDIIAGAGEMLDEIVDFSAECSLTGFEFAAGIWGTIGGAVYGNAGAYGSNVGKILKSAEILTEDGFVKMVNRENLGFAYRHSRLKETNDLIIFATFGLVPGNKDEIKVRIEEIRGDRLRKHPSDACSAGCFFKNVEDAAQPHGKLPAGKLLDEIGAKEMTYGGAGVFEKHANIIINRGNATSKDIRHLADKLKREVKKKFDIDLREEVICLGDF
ncbi:MAG: UDP-N-acetylmuramate dehydrogenase [candidate division Zixibacteria bacterium]